jgi:hypothetical protein
MMQKGLEAGTNLECFQPSCEVGVFFEMENGTIEIEVNGHSNVILLIDEAFEIITPHPISSNSSDYSFNHEDNEYA